MVLNYRRAEGGRNRIEIDLNFVDRLPLLEPTVRKLWSPEEDLIIETRMLSIEELYAGKARAMLDRMAPRDLFDVANLTVRVPDLVDDKRFRAIFIALSGALPHPVYTYERKRVDAVSANDVRNQLYPMLIAGDTPDPIDLVTEAWQVMMPLVDLSDAERAFVDQLQVGELQADLLFSDAPDLAVRVNKHPMLLWKAQNAATHAKKQQKH